MTGSSPEMRGIRAIEKEPNVEPGEKHDQPMPPFTAPRMNTAAVSTQKRYLYRG